MELKFYKNTHLIIATIGSFFLLSLDFPIWYSLIILATLSWRFLGEKKLLPLPRPWLTNSLTLILLAVVLGIYKTIFDRDSSSIFFSCLCLLKILEYKNLRDHLLIVLLLMLLISSKYLFSIDFWILPVTAWLVYHLWLALISCRTQNSFLAWRTRFYFIKVAVVSLPLTLVLYFSFPRLNSYLLKSDLASGGVAVSGFGHEIHPGSISQLAQSQELIFRAEVTGDVYIDHSKLYWRGLNLSSNDGFRWVQGPPTEDFVQRPSKTELIEYKVTMEPTSQQWLFPLDHPLQMMGSLPLLRTREGLYQTSEMLNIRTTIRGQSDLALIVSPKDEVSYLKIPPSSQRLMKLVESLKKGTQSRNDIVHKITNFFFDQNFIYTLNPGPMDEHHVDDFLFRVKKGYCEHFASSFAILARAAGIPARVVIGYQGGEYNSIGNFFSVKAQDAHAWNEYVNDQGEWVRADMVEFVAPARIEMGAAEYLKLPENLRGLSIRQKNSGEFFLFTVYDYLTTYIDSLNFFWTQWLLDFNLDRQSELLKKLPFSFPILLFLFFTATLAAFMIVRLWNFWQERKNLVRYFYKRLLLWSVKQGLPKDAWEGPISFGLRLSSMWPERSSDFEAIVQRYVNFAFGKKPPTVLDLKEMTQSLKRIESTNP